MIDTTKEVIQVNSSPAIMGLFLPLRPKRVATNESYCL